MAQAATDKQLKDHDKRLTDATTKIEGFQKDIEEIRKTLKTGAAARGASAPPAGARNAGTCDLSAFDSSRAQIDAVKTKLEIVFNAYAFDLANAEPTIKQLMQQAGHVGSGVFSVLDVKPFRQGKGTLSTSATSFGTACARRMGRSGAQWSRTSKRTRSTRSSSFAVTSP